jgi:hypothetical protein
MDLLDQGVQSGCRRDSGITVAKEGNEDDIKGMREKERDKNLAMNGDTRSSTE